MPAHARASEIPRRSVERASARLARARALPAARSMAGYGDECVLEVRSRYIQVGYLYPTPEDLAQNRFGLVRQRLDVVVVDGDRGHRQAVEIVLCQHRRSESHTFAGHPRLDLRRGSVGDDQAAIDHDHPLCQLIRFLEVMGGEDDRASAAGEPGNSLAELSPAFAA